MASKVLQVSRLHQNPGLDHRLRWPGPGRLLQDLLWEEVGTARIRIRMRFGIPPDRRAHVSRARCRETLRLYICNSVFTCDYKYNSTYVTELCRVPINVR